ncbi:prepilin-type N-terminal cleavage/methylation domain-containing protein [Pseudomonas gingeri]
MKSNARGFTLLEVLIALSLLGLLMVLIASALTLSNRTLDISERYSNRLNEVRTAQNFLRSALQQSLPVTFLHDEKNVPWVFEGERETMRFVAPVAPQLSGGVQLHSFTLAENGRSSSDLRVSFTPIQTRGLQSWGTPQTLLQNMNQLRLSYRGLDNTLHATGWLDRWPWPERLPQYVRIELTSQGQVEWPPLVVALHLSPAESANRVRP